MTEDFVEIPHPRNIARKHGFHELIMSETPQNEDLTTLDSLDVCPHGAEGRCEGIKDDEYETRCMGQQNYKNCEAFKQLGKPELLTALSTKLEYL